MHQNLTDSTVAEDILNNWFESLSKFIKVMPIEYKRVLEARAKRGETVEA